MTAPWLEPNQDTPGKPPALARKPRRDDPIGRETREALRRRSGGLCELCGKKQATDAHHRQNRRGQNHTLTNLLHLCRTCHQRVGQHVRYALDQGFAVSQYDEPALREVLYRMRDWVWLGADGSLLHLPPAGEPPC